MFISFRKEKMVSSVYLKLSDVFEKTANNDSIVFGKYNIRINNIKWMYATYFDNSEIRCPICGCKASHFRIIKGSKMNFLRLYGFKKINGKTMYVSFNKDHIIPKHLNGSNRKENIQCVCEHCNSIKGHSVSIDYFDTHLQKKKNKIKNMIDEFMDYKSKQKPRLSNDDGVVKNAIKELLKNHYDELEKNIAKKLGYILQN